MAFSNKSIETTREIYRSPVKRIVALVIAIVVSEIAIMILMEQITPFPFWRGAIFDSFILVFMLAPVIYLLIFQPMAKYVSDRRIIEKSLLKEKEFVENLIQTANVIIVGLDSESRVNILNETAENITGYTLNELKGKNWFDVLVPKEKYPELWEELVVLIQKGNLPRTYENPILTKTGEERIISWQNGLLHEGEKITGSISFGIDVTERINAEKEKKQKDQEIIKFKLGIEHSNDAIFITDPEGRITYINHSFEKIFGYTSKEVIGNTPRILKSGLTPPSFYDFLWKTLSSKVALSNEMVNKAKDGSLITVDSSNNPLLDAEGNILGFLSVNRNISERKQRELELQILSEIGQSVSVTANLTELMKLIHGSLKKVLYAENCYFALYDETSNSITFPYFVDQFDSTPEAFQLDRSCTSYVLRTGKSIIITTSIFDTLYEQKEVESIGAPCPSWIGVPLKTASKTIGVLVLQNYYEENVYRDDHLHFLDSIASQIANVIERRRAKEALEKSYSLITATFESTADGILVIDAHGTVTNYNSKFIELWRIPESIILTKDDNQLIAYVMDQLKDPDGFLSKVKELYSHPEETSFDLVEFKDGRIFERYSQPQRFEGRSLGRVWSFRNVTERKRAEEDLKASEARLRTMNSTKDKFFSIISHDLKSPFYGLVGLSDILKKEAYSLDRPTIAEYADLINSSIVQSFQLLENLLEWARMQRDMISFNPSELPLKKLIDEVLDLQADNARKKNITLLNHVGDELIIRADRNMLTTIIRNLLSNAIKFSPFNKAVEIFCINKGAEIEISVRDNGSGISLEDQQRLFKQESNYSTYGTDNESGTGLGLLLCKEFIDKHSGKIWVESEVGVGSNFCFAIPKDI